MQLLGDGTWVISASDLTTLAACTWRVARSADEKLGKGVVVPKITDPMMELVARLGLEHEARQWALLQASVASSVEISYEREVSGADATAWATHIGNSAKETLDALSSQTDAIFQGVFYQESLPESPLPVGFQGFADFLVRSDRGWEVWDSKLARSAKDEALLQLAAYVDQLEHLGVKVVPEVHLILGDGTHSIHDVTPLLPLYREARGDLIELISQRILDPLASPWGDERYVACGTKGCPACAEQIVLHDDLFLIAGMRKTQRQKLRVAGFNTLSDFAQASRSEVREGTRGIGADTLALLHLQASLQYATFRNPGGTPAWEILSPGILAGLPEANPGDVFFDFEGNPNHQEFDDEGRALGGLSKGDDAVWFGIEYLFGMWGEELGDDGFLPLWSESFAEEKHTLGVFCELVEKRLEQYPQMRIYHYASYERTRLAALTKRHRVAGECVRQLLDGVLIDLYPLVMKGVRIGLPSYSLKSLEALYFPSGTRTGIAGGGESVAAFVDYLTAKKAGHTTEAQEIRESILAYNRIDCVSTQALRNWLVGIRDEQGVS
jgi:uncharacterized protein